MSQKLKQNRQKFEQAKLKHYSRLFFDLSKNILLGGFAYVLFEEWNQPINKVLVFILSSSCAIFFYSICLFNLKNYYSQKHE